MFPKDDVNDKSKEVETVFLDSIDGFGFESLCQRIFQKAGLGQVERIGGVSDAGRDLIIHDNKNGKIVVECKHQPKTSIGRPIVQKLHSAIISEGTNKGIIVTTGKFSKQAIDYINELSDGTSIELIGMLKLTELAQRGGIQIISQGEDLRVFMFPITAIEELEKKFLQIFNKARSVPGVLQIEMTLSKMALRSSYEAIVDIHQDFNTSVGHIWSIDQDSTSYFYDGSNGFPMKINSRYLSTYNNTILYDKSSIDNSVEISEFKLERTTLIERIKEDLVEENTTNVQYRGNRNNRIYQKLCAPSKRNIQINDLNQILLPEYTLSIKFKKRTYYCRMLETKSRINFMDSDLFQCRSCRKTIDDEFLLCNSCGNVCHVNDKKNPSNCSTICETCDKTLCPDCAYYIKKFLILKKIQCNSCGDLNPKKKKKLIP